MIYTDEIRNQLIKDGKAEIIKVNVRYISIHPTDDGKLAVFITCKEKFQGDAIGGTKDARTHTLGEIDFFSIPLPNLQAILREKGNIGKDVANKISITNPNYRDELSGCVLNVFRHHINPDEEYEGEDGKIVKKFHWFRSEILTIDFTESQKAKFIMSLPNCPKDVWLEQATKLSQC